MTTLSSDTSGKFSLRLQEAGNYTISTACRQPGGCLPHKLSGELKPGASGEPSIIGVLIGLLLPAQKASADGTSYTFTVGDRGVVLSGQFQDTAGVRSAKAGEELVREDLPGAPVVTSRSNLLVVIAKAGEKPQPDEFPGAPINTSRSNKKHAIVKAEVPPPDDVLPGAPVSTTRSNLLVVIAKAGEKPQPDDLPSEANSALASVSTTRGTAPHPPKSGDKELPGIQGEPIVKIPIGLEGDPGSVKVSTTTGADGSFHFDKLPAGKYKLTLPGLSPQSLTVGGEGIAGGKVMRGPDGSLSLSIFDRWGISVAKPADDDVRVKGKAVENPVGFGRGNAGFGGTGHGMMGGGMPPPGAAMGGAGGPGPMGPGAGGPMGGSPGGAMRP